jgi:hypothetical protein
MIATVSLLTFAAPCRASAEWIKYPNPGPPRMPDDNPGAYTRRWSFTMKFQMTPEKELIEAVGEK